MILTAHIGLSYKCNMKCDHCFVKKDNDALDLLTCKNIIDSLFEMGLMVIIYTYGEPLLADNFDEISSYVSSKGISQVLMTNGTVLNENKIAMLKKNNVENIFVSFDSVIADEHDENRKLKGAFKKANNSVKSLVKNDFNVGLAITINNSNVKYLYEFVEMAQQLKVKNISFLRQRIDGKLVELKENLFYIKFVEDMFIKQDIKKNIMFHDPKLLHVIKELYNNKVISKDEYDKYIDMNSCHVDTTICVAPNGDVTRCNISPIIIGNVIKNNIEYIIKEDRKYESFICCSKLSEQD